LSYLKAVINGFLEAFFRMQSPLRFCPLPHRQNSYPVLPVYPNILFSRESDLFD
jgi:hypothetical protein